MRSITAVARLVVVGTCALTLGATPVRAQTVFWTDWLTAVAGAPGSATGTITIGSNIINVTYAGEILFAQTSGGTNYWQPNAPYVSATVPNEPPPSDIIALIGGNSILNTLTFSSPLTELFMGIVSLGTPSSDVRYQFNTPFTIVSQGCGFWGCGPLSQSGNTLTGREGHGMLRFAGPITSLSWTAPDAENWHGFQVGTHDPSTGVVPEPATVSLLGLGLAGIVGGMARRRRVPRAV